MCDDVQFLMYVLKPKCYVVVGLVFESVRGQIYVVIELLMHGLKPMCSVFVGFDFRKSNV